jgi:hypothetical protein
MLAASVCNAVTLPVYVGQSCLSNNKLQAIEIAFVVELLGY